MTNDWSSLFPAISVDMSRAPTEALKVWLALAALGLALGWRAFPAHVARRALIALSLLATVNYARFGTKVVLERVDTYDLFHYYLNARYFDELGYYDLYPALILADVEEDGPFFKPVSKYLAQDAAGHATQPMSHALDRGRVVKAERFTPERWAAFSHDAIYLQRELYGMSDKSWKEMLQDHGFNGTPAWTAIARPIASAVPVESIKLLCYLDLALLLGALEVVRRVYGSTTAWWSWLFFMLSYSLRWPTLTWAFLRYDYVAALMVGMAAVRAGWFRTGGAFLGWAATLRLFPAMWLLGPLLQGLESLRLRAPDRRLLSLAGGFLLAVGVFQGAAVASVGAEQVTVHLENMLDHNRSDKLSSRRIGLALALSYDGDTESTTLTTARKDAIEAQKPLRFALALGVFAAMYAGLRRREPDEAVALGFLPFYLLTTASYYYYVTRITLVMLHASRLDVPRHRVSLALLMLTEAFAHFAEVMFEGKRSLHIGGQAWFLALYIVWTVGSMLRAPAEAASDDGATSPAPV